MKTPLWKQRASVRAKSLYLTAPPMHGPVSGLSARAGVVRRTRDCGPEHACPHCGYHVCPAWCVDDTPAPASADDAVPAWFRDELTPADDDVPAWFRVGQRVRAPSGASATIERVWEGRAALRYSDPPCAPWPAPTCGEPCWNPDELTPVYDAAGKPERDRGLPSSIEPIQSEINRVLREVQQKRRGLEYVLYSRPRAVLGLAEES